MKMINWDTDSRIITHNQCTMKLRDDPLTALMQDYGLVTETALTMDDFQTLPSEAQSDQIFKLLAILSPLANEVCDLKCNIGDMLGTW